MDISNYKKGDLIGVKASPKTVAIGYVGPILITGWDQVLVLRPDGVEQYVSIDFLIPANKIEFNEDEWVQWSKDTKMFMEGHCASFALALHDLFQLPLGGMFASGYLSGFGDEKILIHAWAVASEREMVDFNGYRSISDYTRGINTKEYLEVFYFKKGIPELEWINKVREAGYTINRNSSEYLRAIEIIKLNPATYHI